MSVVYREMRLSWLKKARARKERELFEEVGVEGLRVVFLK